MDHRLITMSTLFVLLSFYGCGEQIIATDDDEQLGNISSNTIESSEDDLYSFESSSSIYVEENSVESSSSSSSIESSESNEEIGDESSLEMELSSEQLLSSIAPPSKESSSSSLQSSSSVALETIGAFNIIQAEDFHTLYENSANGADYSPRVNMAEPAIVHYFTEGDYLHYKNVDFGEGALSMLLRYAQGFDGAILEIRINAVDGELILNHSVKNTGDWQKYNEYKENLLDTVSGIHDLYIIARHDGGAGDIDYFSFSAEALPEPHVSSSDEVITHCPDDEWKFVAVADSRGGDNGINSGVLSDIKNQIIAEGDVQFVIYPGDMTGQGNWGQEEYFKNLFINPLKDANIDFYGVAGNHEYYEGDFGNFTYLNPNNGPNADGRTFSVPHKNALIVGIGWLEYDLELENWIKPQVIQHNKQHVFSMSHATLWNVYHTEYEATFWQNERDEFINWMTSYGGRAHFTGHDHFYNHSKVTASSGYEMHQFVVGTAGAPYYDFNSWNYGRGDAQKVSHKKTHGYSTISVNGNKVTIHFKELTGSGVSIMDTYEYMVPCK